MPESNPGPEFNSWPEANTCDVAIVGAGISGLVCAYHLQRAGFKVTVLDTSSVPGGKMRSKKQDGFLMELGPSSILPSPDVDELINNLGLEAEVLRVPARKQPRFIFNGQGLAEVPSGPAALAASKLLSWPAKLNIIKEIFITKKMSRDQSLAEFTRAHLGNEILEKLVAPFISGIHAGDAEALSLEASFPRIAEIARKHGSVLRGLLMARIRGRAKGQGQAGMCSFQQGLAQLPAALARELGEALKLEARVESIKPLPQGRGFSVSYGHLDHSAEPLLCRQLVLATGPREASILSAGVLPAVGKLLNSIRESSMLVAQVGVDEFSLKVKPRGFGFLVPRNRGVRCLGVLWTSSVFPGRAPAGQALLTLFYGGALDPKAFELGEQELQEVISEDLGKTMGWDGNSKFSYVHRIQRALPEFALGHALKIKDLRTKILESGHPLQIIGNYVGGLSIPNCVGLAGLTAKEIAIGLTKP